MKDPQPQSIPAPVLISVAQAAQMLGRTEASVRQYIMRGKLASSKTGRNIRVPLEEVLHFFANKKGLPSWEDNVSILKEDTIIPVSIAAQELGVSKQYLTRLVKTKAVDGYVTASGDIVVTRSSVNAFYRTPENDADEL